MKKALSIVLAFIICLTALMPVYAFANEASDYDDGIIQITKEEMKEDAGKYIEQALKLAKSDEFSGKTLTVEVPSGKYNLSKCLHVYSNTNLILQDDTQLVKDFSSGNMLKLGVQEEVNTGYSGYSNITIRGGIWNENYNGTSCGMRFAHCENVTIQNVTIKNNKNSHHMELAAAKNFVIDSCTFSGYKRTGDGDGQAIQIDLMHSTGHFPSYYEYDDTPCKNVTVKNCTFNNVYAGVGTGSGVIGSYFENINIVNNTFNNITDNAICAFNYYNSRITGNRINNATLGILFEYYPNNKLTSRFFVPHDKPKTYAINKNSKSVISSNNVTVKKNSGRSNASGIAVYGGYISQSQANRYGYKKGYYYVYSLNVSKNIIKTSSSACDGIILHYARNCNVYSNNISSFVKSSKGKNGITLRYSPSNLVHKNIVSGRFSSALVGVAYSKYNKIMSNRLEGSQGYGASLDSTSSIYLPYGNGMKSNTAGKINLSGSYTTLLSGNIKVKTVTSKKHKAKLKITPVKYATHYRIYRSTSRNGKYGFVKAVKVDKKKNAAIFTDSSSVKGKTYYYKVELIHQEKGSNVFGKTSSPVAVKVK